jgi:hypothetical protein
MAVYTDEMGNKSGSDDYVGSDDTSRKTANPSNTPEDQFKAESKQVVDQSGEGNVLNGYRSVTYSFTIAALDSSNLKDPESYRNSELKLVILKSGGKGNAGLGVGAKLDTSTLTSRSDFSSRDPRRLDLDPAETSKSLRNFGSELIEGFNSNSPGRFDMFIENVEIDTLMAPSEQTNTSLATQIKFDVIEPYSINGFIEALHVSAISAGYPSYLQASFLLKMEFWGYPDADDFSEPVIVPDATRYFPFGLTGIDVDITEKGTRYRCSAVPYNERAFGHPNVVKKPIKMAGETVGQILADFFKNINAQIANSDKDSKAGAASNKHDTYEIQFPVWDDAEGFKKTGKSKISDSKLTEILKDNTLYKMIDPAAPGSPNAYQKDGAKQPSAEQQAKQPESIKYNPKDNVIQFGEGMSISDAITSVIRDSEYVRNILKNIGAVPGIPDQYGMLDYFLIKIEVTNLDVVDDISKKPFQNYAYIVTPYKIHISRIPNYGHDLIKEENLKKISMREYNYIYTGQNVDILNFKLNFNTLFFEAVPAAMGNKDIVGSKTAAAPNNGVDVKIVDSNADAKDSRLKNIDSGANDDARDRRMKSQVPATAVKTVTTPLQSHSGGNASQPLDDPYSVLARNMHDSVINSKASMLTGELEILGDPIFLVTGGAGNYNPKPKPNSRAKTNTGEVHHNYGEVLVTINFRNPIDINSFEDGGMMKFDSNRVPFSGVYRIIKVANTFKEGLFKQKLDILRLPGQVLDSNLRADDPADRMSRTPNPDAEIIADQTNAMSPTQRMDSATVMDQLNRGLPSPGLPSELSNFTAATGGLGGSTPTLLNQTYGLISRAGALMPTTAIVGQALPSDVASNIRLTSSGLVGLSQSVLAPAAVLATAASVLSGSLPKERAAGRIGGALLGGLLGTALSKSNVGSGIGKGATVSISPVAEVPTSPTMNEIREGANINAASLVSGSLSNIAGTARSIGNNAISAVEGLGKNIGNLVGGVGDKITALTASVSDPQGIAAKVGLDPSRLSGLTGGLQSKLPSQISNIVNSTPENVNLTQAASAGLVLDYIPASKMPNIPATAPYAVAPLAKADLEYAASVVKRGGITALENLYGVNSPSKLSTNLVPAELISAARQQVPNAQVNPFSNLTGQSNPVDLNSMKDKLASAKSQLSGLIKLPNIPDVGAAGAAASKFGSSSLGQSPLDKLVNKMNDPSAPPYTGTDPIVRARLELPPL